MVQSINVSTLRGICLVVRVCGIREPAKLSKNESMEFQNQKKVLKMWEKL